MQKRTPEEIAERANRVELDSSLKLWLVVLYSPHFKSELFVDDIDDARETILRIVDGDDEITIRKYREMYDETKPFDDIFNRDNTKKFFTELKEMLNEDEELKSFVVESHDYDVTWTNVSEEFRNRFSNEDERAIRLASVGLTFIHLVPGMMGRRVDSPTITSFLISYVDSFTNDTERERETMIHVKPYPYETIRPFRET